MNCIDSSRRLLVLALALGLFAAATPAVADPRPLDCQRQSLAEAVERARDKDRTILFTGVCAGPILIRTDGLTLKGVGSAVIDGNGLDAVTVAGAHGVSLQTFEVRNGLNGIVATNGAHVALAGVNVQTSRVFGITLQTASSALVSNVSVSGSGVHGLDLQTGSAATLTGAVSSSNNRVFGINVNGSSITFSQAQVTASANALGIQIATNANAFIGDRNTVLTVSGNAATGLTVVSGGHLVSFGGTINASDNRGIGVSVNSRGGLDLDAGSVLNSLRNGSDGLLIQQGSAMTVFNNPQFSGAPGFSTLNLQSNRGNGLRLANGSTLTLSNQARIFSQDNTQVGLLADNGAGLTLVNATLLGNGMRDLQFTFGVRADLQTTIDGSAACDASVLVRGSSGILCPQ